jgi:TRAP-type C4-dicarboxylate transport system substrate-binding protein
VPEEIVQKLGTNKRPLVRVTINQYTYRSAVAMMGGQFMISLSAENRQAAGVHAGEAVTIALELDLEPRTVDLPQDLKAALIKVDALKAFEQAAPSMQKEYVRQVEEAKTQETRDRRITKIVEKLAGA